MDYIFKIDDGIKFGVNAGKNMQFGVTAGNSGNNVIPDGVITSNTIKHIEVVSKNQYNNRPANKNILYIIDESVE